MSCIITKARKVTTTRRCVNSPPCNKVEPPYSSRIRANDWRSNCSAHEENFTIDQGPCDKIRLMAPRLHRVGFVINRRNSVGSIQKTSDKAPLRQNLTYDQTPLQQKLVIIYKMRYPYSVYRLPLVLYTINTYTTIKLTVLAFYTEVSQ